MTSEIWNHKCQCECGCQILLVASDGFGGTGTKCWKCKIGEHWE